MKSGKYNEKIIEEYGNCIICSDELTRTNLLDDFIFYLVTNFYKEKSKYIHKGMNNSYKVNKQYGDGDIYVISEGAITSDNWANLEAYPIYIHDEEYDVLYKEYLENKLNNTNERINVSNNLKLLNKAYDHKITGFGLSDNQNKIIIQLEKGKKIEIMSNENKLHIELKDYTNYAEVVTTS